MVLKTLSTYFFIVLVLFLSCTNGYDPEDKELEKVIPQLGGKQFEAFYPRQAYGVAGGSARPAHGHASYYSHRHPALVDSVNSAAFGFRFDGQRRFSFE